MLNFNDKTYWIWLSQVPGIGSRRFLVLVEAFGSPKGLYEATDKDILRYSGILGEKAVNAIIERKNQRHLEKCQELLSDKRYFTVALNDADYPDLLKTIFDPPVVLYCKGLPIKQDVPLLSIVGSRRTSEYGRQMADKFSMSIASCGIGIVSGAARGIDTLAHNGAIKAKGHTIAVLGCGVDIVYPRENSKLFAQIEEYGTLMSEYPPGTYPAPANFPARNRIISGLSKALLVIEAGEKSGALITVDFALEQGRDVYALPGNANNPYSAGSNRLLKEGAKLVTDTAEILEEYNLVRIPERNKTLSTGRMQLDIFENEIYSALEDGEKYLEDLVNITGIHIGKLNAILTILEIKGLVKQLPGNIFARRQ